MGEPEVPTPSEVELAILHVLWEQGPSTVREVHERVGTARNTGYTTALKLLQIMARKGMVERDKAGRSHVYRACVERARTQRRLVQDLLDRVFLGSSRDLVMQALSTPPASPQEIAEIRSLLDEMEKKGGVDGPAAGGNT
jgi:predicted transcriptional regulator